MTKLATGRKLSWKSFRNMPQHIPKEIQGDHVKSDMIDAAVQKHVSQKRPWLLKPIGWTQAEMPIDSSCLIEYLCNINDYIYSN